MIVAGSTWNAEIMADDWNMTHIGLVLQGVDLNLYSPYPKKNLYASVLIGWLVAYLCDGDG